jgi:hypothetical protein
MPKTRTSRQRIWVGTTQRSIGAMAFAWLAGTSAKFARAALCRRIIYFDHRRVGNPSFNGLP